MTVSAAALSELIDQNTIKGFLAEDEGEALFRLARSVGDIGPCLEIGSYCGKSTVYLGTACKLAGNTLYAVDHHRGSEEHQLGEEYHDTELFDANNALMDSFPSFRRTLKIAELESSVVPVVASSALTAKHWATPLGLVFIDGGHSHEMAMNDCLTWAKHIRPGGFLAVHDIFEHPEDGGQGPFLALQQVYLNGGFERLPQVNSLGILQRA
ncbi:MAG: hypothetical protein COA42_03335 [Alteromonadaceae bacterium]|nr:MAG: hypothetical protein COA42_03335 [Alteromonadaceae bacterium]